MNHTSTTQYPKAPSSTELPSQISTWTVVTRDVQAFQGKYYKTLFTTLSFILYLAVTPMTMGQLIINADFSAVIPSNGTGNGWTTNNIDSLGGYRSSLGSPDNASGYFILNSNGGGGGEVFDPQVSQTITGLTMGVEYTLSFDYRKIYANDNPNGTQAYRLRVGGTSLWTSNNLTDKNWRSHSVSFTAGTNQALLEVFAEQNNTDYDLAIDNFAISAVPEPSTYATIVGLAMLSISIVRRKART